MLLFDGFVGVVAFGLWMFCIVDVITTRREQVRTLPKSAWLLVVVLLAAIGSVAWLVLGRPWGREGVLVGAGRSRAQAARVTSPDDDEDFLASLDARVREQRRRDRGGHPDDPAA